MAKHTLTVNGQKYTIEADPDTPLLWVLRDLVGLTGTKYGCGMALCGACTVHLNDQPTRSCITPVSSVKSSVRITTIEGLSSDTARAVQAAWVEEQTPQCGYCQSGQIMAATALLSAKPNPTDQDIDDAMSAYLCRCGTYPRIRKAVRRAAAALRKPANK